MVVVINELMHVKFLEKMPGTSVPYTHINRIHILTPHTLAQGLENKNMKVRKESDRLRF